MAQQCARMLLFLVKDGTCRRHKLGRLVVVHGGLDIRMSGKGLNAFKAGSTACELCETAMAKPVRRNVASGDDKGRPFLDESIQPVPRDGASSVAEVFKDRILVDLREQMNQRTTQIIIGGQYQIASDTT